MENESEILGVYNASTEPKLDKFISTAECQRKIVEKEIEWYDDGVRIKRKSVFQETNITTQYRIHTRIQLWQRDEKGEMENMVMFFVCLHCELVCVFSSRNCCCYICECSFVFPLRTHHHILPLCYNHCMCIVYCACSRSIKVNFSMFTGSPKWNASPLCTSLCSVWYSQLDKTVDFSRPRNNILFPALTHVEPSESHLNDDRS